MSIEERDLIVGALVQWTGGTDYGVISNLDASTVYVRWDDPTTPPQFVSNDPPLTRVDLTGQAVSLVSTGQSGWALNRADSVVPTWKCLVAIGGGKMDTVNVPEAGLRRMALTDPVERFQSGDIGSLQMYRLQEVTRWYRRMHLYDELVSLGQIGVNIKPHQVSVAHKVISKYPHRFLLCDEVGLGKTIEAGMVLKELRARGLAQRVLAIVPPNLVRQWQFEMKTKFNETFAVINSGTVRYLKDQGQDGNPFTKEESILCSSSWVVGKKWADQCAEVNWDLIIVDEAHHARMRRSGNRFTRTRLYSLVEKLAAADHYGKRALLFLTATPMQLDTLELFSLVELLNPTLFPSYEHLEQHRKEMPGLSRLAESLDQYGFPLPNEEPEDTAQQVAHWLDVDVESALQRLLAGEEERKRIVDELADRHLLSEVLIRNRKAVIGGFMPRAASHWEVQLTPEERDALQAVEDYVQYGYQLADRHRDIPTGFVMVIFQKLAASSIAALKKALERRQERLHTKATQVREDKATLEERLMNDDDASDVISNAGILASLVEETEEELSHLNVAISVLEKVKVDSKATVLDMQLSILFEDDPNGKVLLFTQFRETQRRLEELFTAKGWGINVFHGQMNPMEKDRAVGRFRDGAGPQILISTEAGGEGRNFQFCHVLVNYDLPWNPMRVEQRIGRVDRIGQEHPVSIFNLWTRDTIEERIWDVLEKRIRLFEETVGGLDPILGDTERDITALMRKAGQERDQAIEALGKKLEKQVQAARVAEHKLGDFILDTKSYRKELAERIAGQPSPVTDAAFALFIEQLLFNFNTSIKQRGDVYDVTFNDDFADKHRNTWFLAGPQKKAVFRPTFHTDSEDVELMVFGHPIVDALVSDVLSPEFKGATGTRQLYANDEVAACKGWLFTYQFSVPGVRPLESIEAVFVHDNCTVDLNVGHSLVERAYQFDSDEKDIELSDIPNNLGEVAYKANRFADDKRTELQHKAEVEATAEVDTEVSRIGKYFDYLEQAARDKVEATHRTLESIRASGNNSQLQILPVWEANLRRDRELLDNVEPEHKRQIAEIESRRYPQVTWSLKALGRIEVVAPKHT